MTKGLDPKMARAAATELERLKWFLWHGNAFCALQVIDDLKSDLDTEDPTRAQAVQDAGRVRPLHRRQRGVDPQLRRALPPRRGELERVRGIRRQPDRQQTHGQETADALVTTRSAPPAPDPNPRPQRRPRRHLPPLVPRAHANRRRARPSSMNSQVCPALLLVGTELGEAVNA